MSERAEFTAWLAEHRGVQLEGDERIDSLCASRWVIQRSKGHRAATDDQLLAGLATRHWAGHTRPLLLDLGAGKGTVSLLFSARWPQAICVGIEAYEPSYLLSLKNRDLNLLRERFWPLLGDLRDPQVQARALAVLDDTLNRSTGGFDLICGAPPFMPLGTGVLPSDHQRVTGRFELRGGLEGYLEAMVNCLAQRETSRALLLIDGANELRALRSIEAFKDRIQLILHYHVSPWPDEPATYHLFVLRPVIPAHKISLHIRDDHGGDWSRDYQSLRSDLSLGGHERVHVLIPARLNSTRLPSKPLLDLGGSPLIARTAEMVLRAFSSSCVTVVSDSEAVLNAALEAKPTPPRTYLLNTECHSGSQRIAHAVEEWGDSVDVDWIINVQGDEPHLPHPILRALVSSLTEFSRRGIRVVTLVAPLPHEAEDKKRSLEDRSIVKVGLCALAEHRGEHPPHPETHSWAKAMFFTRSDTGTHVHVGVYAFRRDALSIVHATRGPLSLEEDLEQVAWMERGEEIGVVCLKTTPPLGINTEADLVRARAYELELKTSEDQSLSHLGRSRNK